MKNFDKLNVIKSKNKTYYAERIVTQIEYAYELAKLEDRDYKAVENAIDCVYAAYLGAGVVTKAACMAGEDALRAFAKRAKQDTVLCVAHGHIDMNWQWGYDETVSTVLATFRTMLTLMNEYADFTYSQSQASCYEIVAEFDKPMLEEIKQRIREGRWEVSASTWVECDKNMTSGESLCRHYIHTKEYLSKLLDISPETLNLDFEPDTFGHSANIPEIMNQAGVKYYYHCRGNFAPMLYRWKAQNDKSSVLVFREPKWYNWTIEFSDFRYVPSCCKEYSINKILKVYGTGDHGGGATRRDLNKLIDMNSWAVMPQIKFSSYREFFNYVDGANLELKEVTGELNYVFTGCYTSQSRIKMGNRTCERVLPESETYSMLAEVFSDFKENTELLKSGWKKTLFNQFHDILPGSGMTETREHASAYTQTVKAIAGANKTNALINLAANIDVSSIDMGELCDSQLSFGAGAGYNTNCGVYAASIACREKRVFHLFNSLPYAKRDICEITLWDFEGDMSKLVIRGADGNIIPHQALQNAAKPYWGHFYHTVAIEANVPPCGFTTVYAGVEDNYYVENTFPPLYERTYEVEDYVLENDFIKVRFDSLTCAVTSLYDKKNKFELLGGKSAYFRLIDEDPSMNMTSWRIGRYNKITELLSGAKIENMQYLKGDVVSTFGYSLSFGNESVLKVKAVLGATSELRFEVECDFREGGNMLRGVPQLSFHFPTVIDSREYLYDNAFGVQRRAELDEDQVGLSFVSSFGSDGKGAMLISDSKYGFRCIGGAMNMSLIRGSFEPDPTPEYGLHKFCISIVPLKYESDCQLIRESQRINNKLSVVSAVSNGKNTLKMTESFISVDGDAFVSAVKLGSSGSDMCLRIAETNGGHTPIKITTKCEISAAFVCDLYENVISECKVSKHAAELTLQPYSVNTLVIKL